MDAKLYSACMAGDVPAFLDLIQHDELLLHQTTPETQFTVLHLASSLGHTDLVREITRLDSGMVSAKNKEMQTPVYEACRQGHMEVLLALLEADQTSSAVYELDHDGRTALRVASRNGHLDIVKHLLVNFSGLLDLDTNSSTTSLHTAAAWGHAEIAREILKIRPDFAWKLNKQGSAPMHIAARNGHLGVISELLLIDVNLCLQTDGNGMIPLHWAATKGQVSVLAEIFTACPQSRLVLTKLKETVLHLTVKNSQYDAFNYLLEDSAVMDMLNDRDNSGMTVLHLASLNKDTTMVKHLVGLTNMNTNARNGNGLTARDLIDNNDVSTEGQQIREILESAGEKKSTEHSIEAIVEIVRGEKDSHDPVIQSQDGLILENENRTRRTNSSDRQSIKRLHSDRYRRHGSKARRAQSLSGNNDHVAEPNGVIDSNKTNLNVSGDEEKIEDFSKISPSRRRSSRVVHESKRSHLSKTTQRNIGQKHDNARDLELRLRNEGLLNARNTTALIAVLIATFSFTAGISPPGGVYQDGPLIGKATLGRTAAFKIFMISNHAALFTSLGIVIVFVSIIPFQRKSMLTMLKFTNKMMWFAVACMAIAFSAATRMIMPPNHGMKWLEEVLLLIACGSVVLVFVGYVIMLAKQRGRKSKFRKAKGEIKKFKDEMLKTATQLVQEGHNPSKIENQLNKEQHDPSKKAGGEVKQFSLSTQIALLQAGPSDTDSDWAGSRSSGYLTY